MTNCLSSATGDCCWVDIGGHVCYYIEEEEKRMYEAMQEGYSAVGFQYSDSTGVYMCSGRYTK